MACVCGFYADALATKIGRGPLPEALDKARKAPRRRRSTPRSGSARRRGRWTRGGTRRRREGAGRGGGHRARGRRAARAVVRGAGGDGGRGHRRRPARLRSGPGLVQVAQLEAEPRRARPSRGRRSAPAPTPPGAAPATRTLVVATAAWCCGACDALCSRLRARCRWK